MPKSLLILGPVLNSLATVMSIGCIVYLYGRIKRKTIIFLIMVQILNIVTQISLLTSYGLYGQISDTSVVGNQNPIFANLNQTDATFLLFKNIAFIGGHATILGIVFCNLEILNLFKVLTEFVTPEKIALWKKIAIVVYAILIMPQWLAYLFPVINVYPIEFVSNWWIFGTLLWPISAIIYDNIQAVFLTRLVYNSNKNKDSDIVVEELRRMIVLNLFTFSLDYVGLGIAVYVQLAATGNDELSYAFNLISFSIPSFHTSLLCIVFVRLKYLALGGKYGKTHTKKPSFSRKLSSPPPSPAAPFMPATLAKKASLMPSFILSDGGKNRPSPKLRKESSVPGPPGSIMQEASVNQDSQLKTGQDALLGSKFSKKPSISIENLSRDKRSSDESVVANKSEMLAASQQEISTHRNAKTPPTSSASAMSTTIGASKASAAILPEKNQESKKVSLALSTQFEVPSQKRNSTQAVAFANQSSSSIAFSGHNLDPDKSAASLCPTIKLEQASNPLENNESLSSNSIGGAKRARKQRYPSDNEDSLPEDTGIGKKENSIPSVEPEIPEKIATRLDVDFPSPLKSAASVIPDGGLEDSIAPTVPVSQASTTVASPVTADIATSPWRTRLVSNASQRPPVILESSNSNVNIAESSTIDSLASTVSSSAAIAQHRISIQSNRSSIASFIVPVPQKFPSVTPISEELADDDDESASVSKPSKASSLVRIGIGGKPVTPIISGFRKPSLIPAEIQTVFPKSLATIQEKQPAIIPGEFELFNKQDRDSVSSNAPTIPISSHSHTESDTSAVIPSPRKPQSSFNNSPSIASSMSQTSSSSLPLPVVFEAEPEPPAKTKAAVVASSRTPRHRISSAASPLRMATNGSPEDDNCDIVAPETSIASSQGRASVSTSIKRSSKTVPKSGRAA